MPSISEIESVVILFIRDKVHQDSTLEIPLDQNIFTSGLLDSISTMRLIAHIEETYQIKISPVDLVPANFRTVTVMANYLKKHT